MINRLTGFLKNQSQSLIFRILLYFLIAALLVAIILTWNFTSRIKPHFQNEVLPNLSQYIEYLVRDIGAPPDLDKARQLTDKLPFELRIEGEGVGWSSRPILNPVNSYELRPAPYPYQNYSIGRFRRHHLLMVESSGYQYMFLVDNNFRSGSEHRHWLLFALLAGTLVGLYLAIRKLFNPVQEISDHLKRIGSGNLDQTIVLKGNTELTRLAQGINDMMLKISSMLESKAALLLAISHELRSPITRMRLNLELLEDSERKKLLVDDIREMEHLVSTILESERLKSGHAQLDLSRFDIFELVNEIIEQHFSECAIEVSAAPITVTMDKAKVALLIKNLIGNACRYSSGADKAVEIKLDNTQDFVRLKVTDHGPGVERAELPKLTDPFYRVDSARQRDTGGYGLGLYLCRLIVEAHQGRLDFSSPSGQGLSVVVLIPFNAS